MRQSPFAVIQPNIPNRANIGIGIQARDLCRIALIRQPVIAWPAVWVQHNNKVEVGVGLDPIELDQRNFMQA